jgi:nicotinate-nucleotide adenylyltransferase
MLAAQRRQMPVPEPGQRWGILGGTFDPVHKGHLTLAHQVGLLEALSGVLLIPAYNHPLKDTPLLADYSHRMAMLELAISEYDDLLVCEIEKEEALPGFTLDTLRALKKRFPGVEFYFIIGLDNLSRIAEWRHPDKILDEASLLVGTRRGGDWEVPDGIPANRIRFVYTEEVNASSTEIRDAIGTSNKEEYLMSVIPDAVLQYIEKNGLYR